MENILVLDNQIIIMESLLCNPNNDNKINKKLREQIILTKKIISQYEDNIKTIKKWK